MHLNYKESQSETLLCRKCGHNILDVDELFDKATTQALRQRNDTLGQQKHILIQLLKNPQGRHFEIITARKANVRKSDQAVAQYSWFSGYAWRLATCTHCGAHLGWSFEPVDYKKGKADSESTFIGLILDHLLAEDFADNLLVMPKAYRS